MQLRGGTEDESGQVVKVSGVMVCAGLVGCQSLDVAEGRTGTKGECGRECGVGSGLGCMSGCSQHQFASVDLASAYVLCPYCTHRCPGQGLVNIS
jgi:hypothetical protein